MYIEKDDLLSFNRTKVELKVWKKIHMEGKKPSFNRTKVELKVFN